MADANLVLSANQETAHEVDKNMVVLSAPNPSVVLSADQETARQSHTDENASWCH